MNINSNNQKPDDKWLKDLFSATGKEKAPNDFTANLMAQIQKLPKPQVYQPLITPRAWWFISALIIGVIILSSQQISSRGLISNWLESLPGLSFIIPEFSFFYSIDYSLTSLSLVSIFLLMSLGWWITNKQIKKIFGN